MAGHDLTIEIYLSLSGTAVLHDRIHSWNKCDHMICKSNLERHGSGKVEITWLLHFLETNHTKCDIIDVLLYIYILELLLASTRERKQPLAKNHTQNATRALCRFFVVIACFCLSIQSSSNDHFGRTYQWGCHKLNSTKTLLLRDFCKPIFWPPTLSVKVGGGIKHK